MGFKGCRFLSDDFQIWPAVPHLRDLGNNDAGVSKNFLGKLENWDHSFHPKPAVTVRASLCGGDSEGSVPGFARSKQGSSGQQRISRQKDPLLTSLTPCFSFHPLCFLDPSTDPCCVCPGGVIQAVLCTAAQRRVTVPLHCDQRPPHPPELRSALSSPPTSASLKGLPAQTCSWLLICFSSLVPARPSCYPHHGCAGLCPARAPCCPPVHTLPALTYSASCFKTCLICHPPAGPP